jgi:hypothetical protein
MRRSLPATYPNCVPKALIYHLQSRAVKHNPLGCLLMLAW